MPADFEKMYSGLKANFDQRHRKTIAQWGKGAKEIRVPIRRLADILDENNIRHVDYMSIDTEGSEWKILRGLDLRTYDVTVLSIENNYQDQKIRNHDCAMLVDIGIKVVEADVAGDALALALLAPEEERTAFPFACPAATQICDRLRPEPERDAYGCRIRRQDNPRR